MQTMSSEHDLPVSLGCCIFLCVHINNRPSWHLCLPCRGGKLYLQASGWRVAKKDRIDLDIGSLKEAQGLYTCPPAVEGGKAFSCCLEVKEDMQVTRQVLSVLDSLPQTGWARRRASLAIVVTGLGPQQS